MTRKPMTALIAALALSMGTAGIASADTGTPGASQGVVAASMGANTPASNGPGIGQTDQGKTQLANELQTFPRLRAIHASDYTTDELVNMIQAARNGQPDRAMYYVNHEDTAAGGPGTGLSDQGKSQLAAQLGLNPADYTTAQLQRMQHDLQRGDLDDANFVVTHGDMAPNGILIFVPIAL